MKRLCLLGGLLLLLFGGISSPSAAAGTDDRLQLHYNFDESDGVQVIDHSGNGNDATLGEKCVREKMTDPFLVQHFGYAVRMGSPINGHRNAAAAINGKALTIEAWIRHESVDGKGYLIFTNAQSDWKSFYHGYSLEVNELNALRLWLGFGDSIRAFDSKFELKPGEFYHLIATYDGAHVKLYVNGRETDVFPEDRAVVSDPEVNVFMGNFGMENRFLLDQIKIYSRCLSTEEINRSFEEDRAANLYKSAADGKITGSVSPNLLLNSSFRSSANAPIPDWWGTFMQNSIREWGPEFFGIDETAEPPIPGVKCLRIANNELTRDNFWIGSTFTNLPGEKDYTFSVYLRTTTPGVKVSAGVFTGDEVWQPDQEFIPTEEWQRFVVSGRRHGKSVMRSLNLQLKGVGVVWIAAPQLEFGLTASEYQPAAADGNMDSSSEPADVPRIVLSGAGQAPVIDGKLDDPVWKDSEELTGFQTNTMPPMAAAVQTVARIAGDEENLYLAFQCTEPEMARLRANAETDDQSAIFEDDSVEIFLSTEHDGSNYYQFVVNSRGVRLDSCNQNNSWNAQWQAAAARGDGFWSVEVKIPVAELNRFRRDGVWRINLCRNRYVSGSAECSSYSPVNGASFHAPGRFAFLSGLPFRQETHSASAVAKVQLPPFQVISEFDYYTDDENATAVVDSTAVKSANGAELQLEVVASGTGETLWKEKFPLPGAFNTRIPFPVKDLPVGEYRLKATALLPDGNAAAVSEDSFRKLPPAPVTQVRPNRAARCLEIDGEPFFGFGSILVYYWLKYATGTAGEPYWQLDDIRSHSQNSMWVGDMGVQSYDERYVEYEDFLDGCAKRGLKVIFNVQSFPAPESAAFRDGIIRFVNRFKGHPAVIAWNYVDEPELWWDSVPGRREADLRMIYEAIKEADPYRPAFINWCHFSDQPYGTLAAGDVVSVDRYPLRYEMLTFKPGIVLDIAAELNRVSRRERKVSMQFLQLQGFWDMSREPSIAELRQMSYGSFLHGTRIIQYLIYRCMSNDLWASVGQLGAELNTLGEFVTAPGARELLVADGEELNWALWRNEDGYLLIYLNSSTEAISTRLNWKEMTSTSLKSAEVLFDGSGVRRNGDELEFNLAPLACGAVAIEAGE